MEYSKLGECKGKVVEEGSLEEEGKKTVYLEFHTI